VKDWRYRELYELEDRHWWFRGRRAVIWAFLRRAGMPASPRILDAGCGTGRNLVEFGKLGEAEGVDFSEDAVAFCHRRGLSRVHPAALDQLPFANGRFDLILATDVIEHVDDDRQVLAELHRVATLGARLVVTVPAYMWLWSQHDVSMDHRRRYTARRLQAQLTAAGWKPVVASYFFSAALPAAAAVRTARRFLAGRNERSDLALAPPALNRVLELPVRAEAKLIECGVRLPAGLSVGMACTAAGGMAP
jgi:SAM-dependent methyltransferase